MVWDWYIALMVFAATVFILLGMDYITGIYYVVFKGQSRSYFWEVVDDITGTIIIFMIIIYGIKYYYDKNNHRPIPKIIVE